MILPINYSDIIRTIQHILKSSLCRDIIRDNRVIKQVGIENYEPQFDNITQNFLDFQYFIQNVLHDDIQFIILGHYQLIDALLEKIIKLEKLWR